MTQELSIDSTDPTFKVSLDIEAHYLAQQFLQQHCGAKAKQVYLNTLAVFAVDRFLHDLEIEADWTASCSQDLVYQLLMDVADLELPGLGKLECRPVLPDADVVSIPPEVWSERIGYVAVQLDKELEEATLLGFTTTVPESGELPLAQLQAIAELPQYLQQIGQAKSSQVQVLSQWFENVFDNGWQSLKTLSAINHSTSALRHGHVPGLHEDSVKGVKLIDLGLQLENQFFALLIAIAPESDRQVGAIAVQLHPTGKENCLPPNIQLTLFSESGEMEQSVQSRDRDNYIQLRRFRCESGECFTIQVTCGAIAVTEKFVV